MEGLEGGPCATAALDLPGRAWSPVHGMTACQYPVGPGSLDRDRMYQHKVSLVVRYFMIPCNICLILLATSTLGFAVLLFLNNCRCPPSASVCRPRVAGGRAGGVGRGGAETQVGRGQPGFSAMTFAFGKGGWGFTGGGALGLLLVGVLPHLFPGKSPLWTGGTWLNLEPPLPMFSILLSHCSSSP